MEGIMAGITEGRIVHYVLPDGRSQGQHRPAIIVRVWGQVDPYPINLHVFYDGTNDYPAGNGEMWKTSVPYSEDPQPGTWHWIERA